MKISIFVIRLFVLVFVALTFNSVTAQNNPLYKHIDAFNKKKDLQTQVAIKRHLYVKKLIELKLQKFSSDKKAFVYAIDSRDFNTAEKFKNKVDLNGIDSDVREFIFDLAVIYGDYVEQICWLIKNGVEIDCFIGIHEEDKNEPDVNKWRYSCATFVERAICHQVMIGAIMSSRPDLFDKPNPTTGATPLAIASENEDAYWTMELLIGMGANINSSDKDGITPLVRALCNEKIRNAILLLNHGARTDVEFEWCGKKYKSVLDFFNNSPIYKNIDTEIEKMLNKKIAYPIVSVKKGQIVLLKKFLHEQHSYPFHP